jgi:putative peptide zinc metalloprotease protein
VQWIYRRETAYAIGGLCLLGLVLTARQIDVFAASFAETLSPSGLLGYLLALAFAKSLHELGHAFTATRYGVRVAHMGVAFLVLWPVLYTDTAESWRLRDRHQRLAIASAGIISELALAGIATLAWSLAEPGDLRQALFFLAATSWLISLGLNASPFMRFDGYFILSDLLDIPNLHERSFALARTWLRNLLLGWNDPEPESFSPQRRRGLIAFAIATWIYRLVVFVGIAVAVYLLFFKLLGIFLFLVEIGWFVIRPLANELKVWRERRTEIRPSRKRLAGLALAGLAIAALIPWNMSVSASAWAYGEHSHVIYSPFAARITHLPTQSGAVKKDALIISLEQPEGRLRSQIATSGEEALQHQLVGLGALPDGEDKRPILEHQRALKLAESGAEIEEAARLHLRAPVTGQFIDLDPELHPGVWVSPHQPLAVVVEPNSWIADAFVGQQDLERIETGDRVRFYPEDNPLFPLSGQIVDIDHQRVAALPHPMLSARFGGHLPVIQDSHGLSPRDPLYRIRVRLSDVPEQLSVRRGTALIDASPRSWLLEALKTVLVVLIREATF